MPQPEASGADAHRQQTDGGEVEVQTSTGGDDDPDDDGGGTEQSHGGDDDGGSLSGVLGNTTVVVALVLVSLVVVYFMYEGAKAEKQMGGGSGNPNRGPATDSAPEGDSVSVPFDRNDPLKADEFVLQNAGIFPSIERGKSGGEGDPALGAN